MSEQFFEGKPAPIENYYPDDSKIFQKSMEVKQKAERLDAKILFHHRNAKGELLSIEREIEVGSQKYLINITPLTRGEWRELFATGNDTSKDQDRELILKHLKDPAVNEQTVDDISISMWAPIVNAILEASGLSFGKSQKKQTTN